jgi:hypothetical protein
MTQALSIAAAPIHPASVAVGTANTGGVDMQLFRRALFVLDVGAFGASATVDMKLQESPDNATFTDLAGTGVAITQLVAGGGNNRLATLEVRAGQLSAGKRYVRALVTVGTAATILACVALGGEADHKPGNLGDIAAVAQRSVVS